MARIVCLSDTHTCHEDIVVPGGDVLIHAGDACAYGTLEELGAFAAWLRQLPHRWKLFVPGNHDWPLSPYPDPDYTGEGGAECREKALDMLTWAGCRVLDRSGVTVEGLAIWGSPGNVPFQRWAFDEPEHELWERRWKRIPEGLDVLITHTPPHGTLDTNLYGERIGSESLTSHLLAMQKRPRLHVFGHCHESYGLKDHRTADGTVTATSANVAVRPDSAHTPLVFDLEPNTLHLIDRHQ